MIQQIRTQVFYFFIIVTILLLVAGYFIPGFYWGLILTVPLVLVGLWDIFQKEHSLLRNYPLVGHLRFLLEDTGPEMRQYIVESNTEGKPFNRDLRSIIYQRSKNVMDKKPFGTELEVYDDIYAWLSHSMSPKTPVKDASKKFKIMVGNEQTTQPYDASVLNISAMSFGSLSGNAILAMNKGAEMGAFAHNTGEGGLSRYHTEHDGNLIWQIGTGYLGCRTEEGNFDREVFKEKARTNQVKMIELKISQGAKPGHGGILPARKITREISEARGVPQGVDCISPPNHSAFYTPIEMCEFIAELRQLSGGKPVGFKLCVGRPEQFFSLCKAFLLTGITPDFITVDGTEGGTGAAPIEFSNHIGMPLKEGIVFVNNALVGIDLRDQIKIAASGKIVTAFYMATSLGLGADWCNTARGFMMATGCIQAQSCHTNKCPVGVTTQDPKLTRGLVPESKAVRVYHYHRNTVEALAEVISAAGLSHPSELGPELVFKRTSPTDIRTYAQIYKFLEPGQLLEGNAGKVLQPYWEKADPKIF